MVIAETSMDTVTSIACNAVDGKFSKVSHEILHMIVGEGRNYKRSSVVFASWNVAQLAYMYDKTIQDAHSKVIQIMSRCSTEPGLRGIHGQMFKSFCHLLLCSGKNLRLSRYSNNYRYKSKSIAIHRSSSISTV